MLRRYVDEYIPYYSRIYDEDNEDWDYEETIEELLADMGSEEFIFMKRF